ncbi:MAG TPA: hypothetical protein VGN64_01250 [Dyadobacter sp.]|jgi:hypothetical protein|nr:hypothetical protein [Dyadobacter sp.]
MIHEKIFKLAVGREAKIVIKSQIARNSSEVNFDLEFLIRDHEEHFRAPIGMNHPQFWKLKKYTAEKSRFLQLEYSGLSRKQLKESIEEFKAMFGAGYTFRDKTEIGARVKSLKGIRVSALSRRMLA